MSEIKVDTLTGKTTAKTVTVGVGATATQSLEQGLAKSWVNWNGIGTVAVRDSLNVSSITDDGPGNYDVNYSNIFSIAGYCVTTAGWGGSGISGAYDFSEQTTTYVNIRYYVGGYYDSNTCNTAIHGDLA